MEQKYEVTILKEKVEPDYQIKAVFLGNSGVGKTSIIKYEIDDKVCQKSQPTAVFTYFSKTYKICEKIISLQMWDIGGDSTYENLITNFYTASLCIFFVFSLDDKDSFYNIERWIKNVKNEYQSDLPFLILIGNKKDKSDKKITKEEIDDIIIKNGINYYYETSAKNGESIHELFEDIIKKLYIKYIEPNFSDTYSTKSVSTTRSLMNPCGSESEKCKVCDCNIF